VSSPLIDLCDAATNTAIAFVASQSQMRVFI
jgi:hypothetical protein